MSTNNNDDNNNNNTTWQERLQQISTALHSNEYDVVCSLTTPLLTTTTEIPETVVQTIQQIHVKSLLQQSKYTQVIEYGNATSFKEIPLEYAYALYKLKHYTKCRDFLLKQKVPSVGLQTLLAQCYYRLHNAKQASDLYSMLLKDSTSSSSSNQQIKSEQRTNWYATLVSTATPAVVPEEEESESYEVVYNRATHRALHSTSRATLEACLQQLQDAYDQCLEQDPNDTSSQASIQANQAFCHLQLGHVQTATRLYLQLSTNTTNNKNATLVQKHNMAVIYSKKTSDAKLVKLPFTDATATPHQIRTTLYNRILQHQQLHQNKDAKESLSQLKKLLKSNTTSTEWKCRLAILTSTITNNNKGIQDLLHQLLKQTSTSSSPQEQEQFDKAVTQLMLHQFVSNDDTTTTANSSVEELIMKLPKAMQCKPAIVAILATLYNARNDDAAVQQLLTQMPPSLACAQWLLQLGRYEQAASTLESILATNTTKLSDATLKLCQAGLIQALSHFDLQRATELSSTISFSNNDNYDDTTVFNGEELEAMEVPRFGATSSSSSSPIQQQRDAATNKRLQQRRKNRKATLRQRKKKREMYLAKLQQQNGTLTTQPPNPERWISKAQRSHHTKRGRKFKLTGAAQGVGSEQDSAKLDVAARLVAANDVHNHQPSTAHLRVASNGYGKGPRRR